MDLVLLCVDIRHEMIGSITNRFILGVYHDPMVMQQVMSDFKEKIMIWFVHSGVEVLH